MSLFFAIVYRLIITLFRTISTLNLNEYKRITRERARKKRVILWLIVTVWGIFFTNWKIQLDNTTV